MLVTERDTDAETNVKVLDEVMIKWRITINCGKTVVMVVKRGGDTIMQQRLSEWGGNRQCEDNYLVPKSHIG